MHRLWHHRRRSAELNSSVRLAARELLFVFRKGRGKVELTELVRRHPMTAPAELNALSLAKLNAPLKATRGGVARDEAAVLRSAEHGGIRRGNTPDHLLVLTTGPEQLAVGVPCLDQRVVAASEDAAAFFRYTPHNAVVVVGVPRMPLLRPAPPRTQGTIVPHRVHHVFPGAQSANLPRVAAGQHGMPVAGGQCSTSGRAHVNHRAGRCTGTTAPTRRAEAGQRLLLGFGRGSRGSVVAGSVDLPHVGCQVEHCRWKQLRVSCARHTRYAGKRRDTYDERPACHVETCK